MVEVFRVKVRKVGDSLGFLIPKWALDKENIKEGEEIEVSVLKKRKLAKLLKLFGSVKDAEPFERDREDRLDREGY